MAATQNTGTAGLAPQMSIVNADGTPTVFFFRWLLNTAATAAAGGNGGGTAPGDDTQVVFNQGGSLSSDPTFTFHDGSLWLSGPAGTGVAAPLFNSTAEGADHAFQQKDGRFYVTGAGDGYFQNLIVTATFNSEATGTTAAVQQYTGTFVIFGNGNAQFQALSIAGPLTFPDGTVQVTAAVTGGGGGSGSVTSVALSMPPEFTVAGSPVTAAGTLAAAWASQAASLVHASPAGAAGVPAFRALAAADFSAGVIGGFQTPWLQNISAARFNLSNAGYISVAPTPTGPWLDLAAGSTTATPTVIRIFTDSSLSSGASLGNAVPGGTVYPGALILGTYNGSAWADRLHVTNAGNVGIGTSTPGATLDVIGTGPTMRISSALTGQPQLSLNANAGASPVIRFFLDDVPTKAVSIGLGAPGVTPTPGDFTINTWNGSAYSERLRVLNTGNVGIGIAAPTAQLHVSGPAGGASLALTDATNSTLTISHSASPLLNSVIYNTGGTAKHIWQVNGVNAMCLTNAGVLGVGTTAPNVRLHVIPPAAPSSPPPAGTYGGAAIFGCDSPVYGLYAGALSTGNAYLQAQRGDSAVTYNLLLQPNGGNVGIGTTAPGSKLSIVGLPTSAAGLATGDIWRDPAAANVLKIVP